MEDNSCIGCNEYKCTRCPKIVHSIGIMPQKYKTAYNPIIDTTYKLLVSDNEEEIKKYLSENVDDLRQFCFQSNGETHYKNKTVIMWAKQIPSAIHELVHGACMPYENFGFKFDDELLAYTMKFLYKELIENYNNPQVGIVFTGDKK